VNQLHLTIRSGNDNDSAIHVGSTSNHVLNVISVTGAVDVGIVAGVGRVLNMGGGNGDTTLSFFGGLVNGTILEKVSQTLLSLTLGNGSGQSSLKECYQN
jgi:hypothetical protein